MVTVGILYTSIRLLVPTYFANEFKFGNIKYVKMGISYLTTDNKKSELMRRATASV